MMENIKMLVVLSVISAACGALLAGVHQATAERIENQILKYVQGPAVQKVLASSDNNTLDDRRKIEFDGKSLTVFVGKKQGQPWALAYETFSEGFGGVLGVMVGYDLQTDKLTGIGITSHKETPGVGARVTEDGFTRRFEKKPVAADFRLSKNKGEIDALTGASVSSEAVSRAVTQSAAMFAKIKSSVSKGQD